VSFWSKLKERLRAKQGQPDNASENFAFEEKSPLKSENEKSAFEDPRHARTKNLIYAEAAVKYVKEKLFLRSGNRPIDEVHGRALSGKLRDIDVRQRLISKQKKDVAKKQPLGLSAGAATLWRADQAEAFGMGNCDAQADDAFKYLLHHTDAKEVSLLAVGDNHALIVIGASPSELESAKSARSTFRLDEAPKLPEQAVFCDPWDHEWFPASEWPNKIKPILRQTQVEDPEPTDDEARAELAMFEAAGISIGTRKFSESWKEIDVWTTASKRQDTIAEYQEYLRRHPDAVAPQRTSRAATIAAAEARADSINASAAKSAVKSNQHDYDERPRSRDSCR
jgi:hypothetical protein